MGEPNPDIYTVNLDVPYRYIFQGTVYFIQQSLYLSPNNKSSHFNPKFNSTYIFTRSYQHWNNCWCVEPQRGTVSVQQSQCHPLAFPPAIREDLRSDNSQRNCASFVPPRLLCSLRFAISLSQALSETAIREIRSDRHKFPRILTSLMWVLSKTGLWIVLFIFFF